ncbi:MAG: translation initiation factor eIF-2B [Halobacteriaceae archaeon]
MIDETAAEIREMRTHSSSVVATKAARALRDLLDREYASVEEYVRSLERNSQALIRANPSHASLVTTQREIQSTVEDADADTVAAAKEVTRDVIDRVIDRVETAAREAAANVAADLSDGDTVLTHDYSTTVTSAIQQAADDGASLSVYTTESRPLMLGRKSARTLADIDAVDVTLVVDSAAGHVLDDCDRVLLGMDCIVEDALYNRVGTYPLAATAADADVPLTVTGASTKIVESGFRFENDFRATSEVIREPPEGFDVENPAYDATPVRLVDEVVTEDGPADV